MKDLPGLIALSAVMGISMSASAAEIHVMSGGAPKEVFALLTPKFEQQTGHKVKFTYAVITAMREKLAAGEKADVLVMPVPVLDALAKEGKVRADARAMFGTLGISVVVKEGAAKPDISTKEKFKAGDARRQIGGARDARADAERQPHGQGDRTTRHRRRHGKKVIHKPALDGGVELVASGEAEIGILSGERSRRHQRHQHRRAAAGGDRPHHRLRRGGDDRAARRRTRARPSSNSWRRRKTALSGKKPASSRRIDVYDSHRHQHCRRRAQAGVRPARPAIRAAQLATN